MDLAELTSCRELGPEHIEDGVSSASRLRALLGRAAEVAQPEDGAPKILFVFARLARGDVDWLEGELTIELAGDDSITTIDVYKEEGWGIRERLAPQTRFVVPFDEFSRAVEISAKRFLPLKVSLKSDKIVLSNAKATPPAAEMPSPMPAEEPEPFALPAAAEPEPFGGYPVDDEAAAFLPVIDPKRPEPAPQKQAPVPMPEPTPEPATPREGAPKPKADPIHSRPTVRRMVAIKPEALRTGRKDPRREDDD